MHTQSSIDIIGCDGVEPELMQECAAKAGLSDQAVLDAAKLDIDTSAQSIGAISILLVWTMLRLIDWVW